MVRNVKGIIKVKHVWDEHPWVPLSGSHRVCLPTWVLCGISKICLCFWRFCMRCPASIVGNESWPRTVHVTWLSGKESDTELYWVRYGAVFQRILFVGTWLRRKGGTLNRKQRRNLKNETTNNCLVIDFEEFGGMHVYGSDTVIFASLQSTKA